MNSADSIIKSITDQLSLKLKDCKVSDDAVSTMNSELKQILKNVLEENNFYKQINEEMQSGLKGIYKQISSATNVAQLSDGSAETQQLLTDTTKTLDEAMQTMLQATNTIMDLVEGLIDKQDQVKNILSQLNATEEQKSKIKEIEDVCSFFEASLTEIITSLSFQDLTGQRLKKVLLSLESIENHIFELYVSTGLMLKTYQDEPQKDMQTIKKESLDKAKEIKSSELKGPTLDVSQNDVDDLLASLGL